MALPGRGERNQGRLWLCFIRRFVYHYTGMREMKGSKMALTFLRYGARATVVGMFVAALSACVILVLVILYMLLTPILQVIWESVWESGWVPLGLVGAAALFMGGGLFGVFMDIMDPPIRKRGTSRSHE